MVRQDYLVEGGLLWDVESCVSLRNRVLDGTSASSGHLVESCNHIPLLELSYILTNLFNKTSNIIPREL
jgi:hypothetical protein